MISTSASEILSLDKKQQPYHMLSRTGAAGPLTHLSGNGNGKLSLFEEQFGSDL